MRQDQAVPVRPYRTWRWVAAVAGVGIGACGFFWGPNLVHRETAHAPPINRKLNLQGASPPLASCYEAALAPTITKERFPFCSVMEAGTLVLYWNHDLPSLSHGPGSPHGNITFAVAARSGDGGAGGWDWVALGLSNQGTGMRGADIAMLRKTDTESGFVLEDRYSQDYELPLVDSSQDKTLLFAEQRSQDSLTVFGFSMPTRSCGDSQDVTLDPDLYTHVMWASGMDEEKGGEAGYHGESRGSKLLLLLALEKTFKSGYNDIVLPKDAKTVRVTFPEMEIPAVDSLLLCMLFEMPYDRKYHIYQTKAIGEFANYRKFTHHFFARSVPGKPRMPLNEPFECADDGLARLPQFGVVNGIDNLVPEGVLQEVDAAVPFGKGYPQYWGIELHIVNAGGVTGVRDTFGFEITYSPQLRKHDVGVFATGAPPCINSANMTSPLAIPPNVERFDYINHCPSSCMAKRLNNTPRYVIASALHMHQLGVSGESQILRSSPASEGKLEQVTTIRRDIFDARNQQNMVFRAPGLRLLPTDRIITRCTYSSLGETEWTHWGLKNKGEEMCAGFHNYYPAVENFACTDLIGATQPLLDQFRAMDPNLEYVNICSTDDLMNIEPDDPNWFNTVVGAAAAFTPLEERADKERWAQERIVDPAAAARACED